MISKGPGVEMGSGAEQRSQYDESARFEIEGLNKRQPASHVQSTEGSVADLASILRRSTKQQERNNRMRSHMDDLLERPVQTGSDRLDSLNRTIAEMERRIEAMAGTQPVPQQSVPQYTAHSAPSMQTPSPTAGPDSLEGLRQEIMRRKAALAGAGLAPQPIPAVPPQPVQAVPQQFAQPHYAPPAPPASHASAPITPNAAPQFNAQQIVDSVETQYKSLQSGLGNLRAELQDVRNALNDYSAQGVGSQELQQIESGLRSLHAAPKFDPSSIDALRSELSDLKISLGTAARQDSWETGYHDLADRIDALASIAHPGNLETIESQILDLKGAISRLPQDNKLDALEGRLYEMAEHVKFMASNPPKLDVPAPDFSLVEARLDQLVRMLAEAELAGKSQAEFDYSGIERVEARIVELADVLTSYAAVANTPMPAPQVDLSAIDRLEGQILELNSKISAPTPEVDLSGIGRLEEQVTALNEKIATSDASSEKEAPVADTAGIKRLEEKLELLSTSIAARAAPPEVDMSGISRLEARVTALTDALDSVEPPQVDLSSIGDLSKQIEALSGQFSELEQRDSDRIASFVSMPDQAPDFDKSSLENQIESLASRLEEIASSNEVSPQLASLESQLAVISDSLVNAQMSSNGIVDMSAVTDRLSNIERQIHDNRDYAMEAAAHAAQTAVKMMSNSGVDNKAVEALGGDIKALHEISLNSETRTSETFEAVHETLERIVGRLGEIEASSKRHKSRKSAYVAAAAGAVAAGDFISENATALEGSNSNNDDVDRIFSSEEERPYVDHDDSSELLGQTIAETEFERPYVSDSPAEFAQMMEQGLDVHDPYENAQYEDASQPLQEDHSADVTAEIESTEQSPFAQDDTTPLQSEEPDTEKNTYQSRLEAIIGPEPDEAEAVQQDISEEAATVEVEPEVVAEALVEEEPEDFGLVEPNSEPKPELVDADTEVQAEPEVPVAEQQTEELIVEAPVEEPEPTVEVEAQEAQEPEIQELASETPVEDFSILHAHGANLNTNVEDVPSPPLDPVEALEEQAETLSETVVSSEVEAASAAAALSEPIVENLDGGTPDIADLLDDASRRAHSQTPRNLDYLKNARRAAQAAEAEAAALMGEEQSKKAAKGKSRISLPKLGGKSKVPNAAAAADSVVTEGRSALARSRKPIMMGLGAVVLGLAAIAATSYMLPSGTSGSGDTAELPLTNSQTGTEAGSRTPASRTVEGAATTEDSSAVNDRTSNSRRTDRSSGEGARVPRADGEETDVASRAVGSDRAPTPKEAADVMLSPRMETTAGNDRQVTLPAPDPQTTGPAVSGDEVTVALGNTDDAVSLPKAEPEVKPTEEASKPTANGATVEMPSKKIGSLALRQAAANGNPSAQFEVGARYTDGKGVKRDLKTALKWYERAAANGFAPAQYRVGSFHEKGIATGKIDPQLALTWYQRAADLGNARAMHNLGVLLADPAQNDLATATKWFHKAAAFGVKDSQFNLGVLYGKGMGVPQDVSQSYKWFALAAKTGDTDAAKKRDEMANAMQPDVLKAAREEVRLWAPQKLDPDANRVIIPEEWQSDDIRSASVKAGETDASASQKPPTQKEVVLQTQLALNELGYNAGPADGVPGPKTVKAIIQFKKKVGMKPNAVVDGKFFDALKKELQKS